MISNIFPRDTGGRVYRQLKTTKDNLLKNIEAVTF